MTYLGRGSLTCIHIYEVFLHAYILYVQGTAVHGLIRKAFVRVCAEFDSGEVLRCSQRLARNGHTSMLWPRLNVLGVRESALALHHCLCVHHVPEEPKPQTLKDESIFHWCMKGWEAGGGRWTVWHSPLSWGSLVAELSCWFCLKLQLLNVARFIFLYFFCNPHAATVKFSFNALFVKADFIRTVDRLQVQNWPFCCLCVDFCFDGVFVATDVDVWVLFLTVVAKK